MVAKPANFGPREAQPLGALMAEPEALDKVLENLWPKDIDDAALKAAREADQEKAAAFARLFSAPEGRAVLEILCDVTLRRPSFIASLNIDPMRAYGHGVFREGQNALVYFILQMIAKGRDQTPPSREGV